MSSMVVLLTAPNSHMLSRNSPPPTLSLWSQPPVYSKERFYFFRVLLPLPAADDVDFLPPFLPLDSPVVVVVEVRDGFLPLTMLTGCLRTPLRRLREEPCVYTLTNINCVYISHTIINTNNKYIIIIEIISLPTTKRALPVLRGIVTY